MELITINKHVKTDGQFEYYYNDRSGKWEPGYYDGRKFIWKRTRTYSARHSKLLQMPDGTKAFCRLSRYTYREYT